MYSPQVLHLEYSKQYLPQGLWIEGVLYLLPRLLSIVSKWLAVALQSFQQGSFLALKKLLGIELVSHACKDNTQCPGGSKYWGMAGKAEQSHQNSLKNAATTAAVAAMIPQTLTGSSYSEPLDCKNLHGHSSSDTFQSSPVGWFGFTCHTWTCCWRQPTAKAVLLLKTPSNPVQRRKPHVSCSVTFQWMNKIDT